MNIIGYLISLANLQYFTNSPDNIHNISFRVSEVGKLAEEIKRKPVDLEGLKRNGFYRQGDTGKYISKNVLEYIQNKDVDPKELGLFMTFYFSDREPPLVEDNSFTTFVHKKGVGEDVVDAVDKYFELVYGDREKK